MSATFLLLRGSSGHVDPSRIPLDVIAQIRGAMWTARLDVQYGPRPYKPSNILVAGAAYLYAPEEQQRQLTAYTGRGYTHTDIGPWIPPDNTSGGYHNYYPTPPQSFEQYLDSLQVLWDAGICPICFIKPDNWDAAQMQTLTPYYAMPRARQLIRAACIAWEPSEDTPNAEWVRWAQCLTQMLPDALHLIHMNADFDAPGNNVDLTEYWPDGTKNPLFIGAGACWGNMAPYLHGYLNQVAGYINGASPTPTPQFLSDYAKLFDRKDRGSLNGRFETGYAGWPTNSQWGVSKPIRVYAGEFAAYADFYYDWPEADARAIGDWAMTHGAYGYLDGGTVPVPFVPA